MAGAGDPLVVATAAGLVRGERRGDLAQWRGVPYAAPPIGARRFRPPEPPAAWAGVRDATRFGAASAQSRDLRLAMMSGITDKIATDEDCLTVNVFAPAPGAGGPYPVVVWIHGGAFVMGTTATPLYHGGAFAADGVVMVTVNYRLGLAGMLYLGELAPGYAAGNCALLDQIAALRWVRDHIAGFGGDPGQVTVMGESAGAIAIGALLAMPAARGLFHRAILQSGASALAMPGRAEATALARRVIAALGVEAAALADVPIERLLEVQAALVAGVGVGTLAPYVDGVSLPAPAIDALCAGSAAGVPVLLGTNRDEWTLFEVLFGEQTIDALRGPLTARLGDALAPLLAAYRAERPEPRTDAAATQRAWVDLIGDAVFRLPCVRLAEAQAAAGAPAYLYRFDWPSPSFGGRLGAGHAVELPFVWNRLDLAFAQLVIGSDAARQQPLASAVHASWVAFIRTGDPNGGGLPTWPTYDATRRATMRIDRPAEVVDDLGGATRALWPARLGPARP